MASRGCSAAQYGPCLFPFRSLAYLGSRRARKTRQRPSLGLAMTFAYRVDRWTDDGNSILDYVAAVADLAIARAAYRAACRRWPGDKITLRQAARVIEQNWPQ
jgi:hypothetical protein